MTSTALNECRRNEKEEEKEELAKLGISPPHLRPEWFATLSEAIKSERYVPMPPSQKMVQRLLQKCHRNTRLFLPFVGNSESMMVEPAVRLKDSGIDDEDLRVLCYVMKKSTKLVCLDLSNNPVTDVGVKMICDVILGDKCCPLQISNTEGVSHI